MIAPDNIGLLGDGYGMWALAHNSEADIAVLYTRSDLFPALIAEAVAREREAIIAIVLQENGLFPTQAIAAAIRARGQD